jgi:hypothetical protein
MHLPLAGAEGQRAAQHGDRLFIPAQPAQRDTVVRPQQGIVSYLSNRLVVGLGSFPVTVAGPQGIGQAVESAAVPWVQGESAAGGHLAVRIAAFFFEHDRKVGAERGCIRAVGDRLLKQLDRRFGLACLLGDQAEQMQCVRVARVGLQDAPIDTLGLQEATPAMALDRIAQQLLSLLVGYLHGCGQTVCSHRRRERRWVIGIRIPPF